MPLLDSPNTERTKNMKNNYSVAERNAIVEESLPCIDTVMRCNRKGIRRAGLEEEDVYQQLALRLITAVESYDPKEGDLETHIRTQLLRELRRCERAGRRFSFTDAANDLDDSSARYGLAAA